MHDTLPDFERRAFEKLLEEDDFLKDAYAGLKLQTEKENRRAISKIESEIDIITGAKKPRIIALNVRTMAVAAMIIIFLSISFLLINQLNKTEQQKIATIEAEQYTNPGGGILTDSILKPVIPETHSDAEFPVEKSETKKQLLTPVQVENTRTDENISAGVAKTEPRPSADIFTDRSESKEEERVVADDYDFFNSSGDAARSDSESFTLSEVSVSTSSKDVKTSKPEVLIVVEQMPEYPGGDAAMMKFLAENLKYPDMAKDNGVEGTVYIKFIVNSKGKISNAEVIKGIGSGCDEEALRVVKKMPQWNPGTQEGKPVDVYYTLPIKFKLQ